MVKYLDPKNDLTFKKIFGEHKHLCMSLLNSLLPLAIPIRSIEYVDSELVPVKPELKDSIVDVRCKDELGRSFIVEMQILWTPMFFTRVLYNSAKVMSNQLKRGDEYDVIQPVYALSLVNACFRTDTDEFYHRYLISDVAAPGQQIEGMEFVFVELPKFQPKTIAEKKMAVLWLRFLTEINTRTNAVPQELLDSPEIKEALEYVEESAFDDKAMDAYDHYLDVIRTHRGIYGDLNKAVAEAEQAKAEAKAEVEQAKAEAETKIRKAKAEAKAEVERSKVEAEEAIEARKAMEERMENTARKLKELGLSPEEIRQATGFPLEKISKLK